MSTVRPPWEGRQAQLSAYYTLQNRCPRFRQDLRFTFCRLDALEIHELYRSDRGWPSAYWDDDEYILLGQMLTAAVAPQWIEERARMYRQFATALLVRHILEGVARRWALPRHRGADDLWECYSYAFSPWGESEDDPELWVSSMWVGSVPDIATHSIVLSESERSGRKVRVVRPLTLVEPTPLTPIEYRPERGESWETVQEKLRKQFAQVERDAQRQAKAVERRLHDAGWRRQSPRHLGEDGSTELIRGALRLYRRAVLAWTYEHIADAEPYETYRPMGDARSVRQTVGKWARDLGVSLPRSRPGRRPKPA